MERRAATWPDLTYRLIEHYKWEPNGLKGTVSQFYARLLSREVPLNFLFNILLRCASSKTIDKTINALGHRRDSNDMEPFRLEHPFATKLVQPDVLLESDRSRIFIEVKLGAKTSLEQIQKYLILHAEMDALFGEKRPYILFLTDIGLLKSWQPAREVRSFQRNGELFQYVCSLPIDPALLNRIRKQELTERIDRIRAAVSFGANTWAALGRCLTNVAAELETDSCEARLIGDFVDDLKRRNLCPARPPASAISEVQA